MERGTLRSRIAAWADEVVPALTLAGLLLYALLRLPYSVFYGLLGASPDEAGLGYVETLGRSTTGLVAVALVVGCAALAVAAAFTALVLYARLFRSLRLLRHVTKKRLRDMTDDEYAVFRTEQARVLGVAISRAEDIRVLLARTDEQRDLGRLADPTPEQRRRRDRYRRGGAMLLATRMLTREIVRLSRRFATRAALVAAVAAAVALPFVAAADAGAVRHCRTPRLGRLGLFAIRGDEATLERIGDAGTTTPVLPALRLRYLGTDGDRVVLYDCEADHTIRLPADDLLVTTS